MSAASKVFLFVQLIEKPLKIWKRAFDSTHLKHFLLIFVLRLIFVSF